MIEPDRHSSLVYVDANPFIYAVEGDDITANAVKEFFGYLSKHPGVAVTSELTLAEVLPKAPGATYRRSYLDLIVWSGIFTLQPISRDVLVETADYRRVATKELPDGRKTMPKLPDAIHVVTAIRSGCTKMVSADAGLRLPAGMALFQPSLSGFAALMKALP